MGDFLRVPSSHGKKKPGEGSVAVNSSISNSTKAEDRYYEGLERNEEARKEARKMEKLRKQGLSERRALETISEDGGSSYISSRPKSSRHSTSGHSQIPSDSGVSTASKRSIKPTDRNALVLYESDEDSRSRKGSNRSHVSSHSKRSGITPSLVGSDRDPPLLDRHGNPGVRHIPAPRLRVQPPSDNGSNSRSYAPSEVSDRLSDASSRHKSYVSSEAPSSASKRSTHTSRSKSYVPSEALSSASKRSTHTSRPPSEALSYTPRGSSRGPDSYVSSVSSQRRPGGGSTVTSSTVLPPAVEINNVVVSRHGSRRLARSGSENEMVMESFTMHRSSTRHRRVLRDDEGGDYYDD